MSDKNIMGAWIMRLNNKTINTEKQFKDNFLFSEVWEKLKVVLFDLKNIAFIDKIKKDKLLNFINMCMEDMEESNIEINEVDILNCFQNGLNVMSLNDNFNFFKFEEVNKYGQKAILNEAYSKTLIELYNEIFKIKSWSVSRKNNTFCVIVALHCLADKEIKDVSEIINSIWVKEDDIEAEEYNKLCIELINSDEPYKIPCYDFKACNSFEIVTKKITNITDSNYGSSKIHIVGVNQSVLQTFELKPKESMYINTINNQFVQAIPNISTSNYHAIYRCNSNDGESTLKRKLFKNNSEYLYDSSKFSGLTQFTVDDENGFIAIVSDRLEIYSNGMFDELFDINENPVWVSIQGSQYIILTSKGSLITNFAMVKEWKNIISIFFSNNAVIGITSNGRIVSTDINLFLDTWFNIISISAYANRAIGMDYNGNLFFQGCTKNKKLKGKIYLCLKGYVVLDDSNSVWLTSYSDSSEPVCIMNNIKEIAVASRVMAAKSKDEVMIFYNFESE